MKKLKAEDIWFTYTGEEYILKGAALEAPAGTVTALAGPTGCGKSTLLLILAGLLKPQRGRITINGADLADILEEDRSIVGIVFQNPDDQLFNPTVYDEIAYAPRTLGLPEQEVRKMVLETAERLGITHLLDKPPYRLSMGQKRLVALASVLVYQPEILLLDEPSTFLDKYGLGKVEEVIEEYKKTNKIIIMATHNLDMVLGHADNICILQDGKTTCRPREKATIEWMTQTSLPIPSYMLKLIKTCSGRGA